MMNVLSPPHVRKRDFLEHVLTWPVRGSLTREMAPGIVYRRESVQFPGIRKNVADENIRGTRGIQDTLPANDWEPMRFELGFEGETDRGNRQSDENVGRLEMEFLCSDATLRYTGKYRDGGTDVARKFCRENLRVTTMETYNLNEGESRR